MITKTEYLRAKEVIKEYEEQQKHSDKLNTETDIDLFTVLSTRAKNVLANNGLRFISDVVRYIKQDGYVSNYSKTKGFNALIKFRDMGAKSYKEIMSHVEPYLND